MRHYVLPDSYDGSRIMELQGDEFHYLTRVLRKRPGDRFDGIDPHGNPVSIHLKQSKPGRCVLDITAAGSAGASAGDGGRPSRGKPSGRSEQAPQRSAVDITLFQCIPKTSKMDLIVRQAVEAGVDTIVPVLSGNSVPRLDQEKIEKKRERWMRIARQAMQQSGRQKMPGITTPVMISEVPRLWRETSGPTDVCLLFYEKPVSKNGLHNLLASGPQSVGICIGPEGGFSPEEAAALLHSGLQPVYINTNVLRTETAVLYAIAAVQTVVLERDYWKVRR